MKALIIILVLFITGCTSVKENPTVVNCKAICENCEKCELMCDGVGRTGDTISITRP